MLSFSSSFLSSSSSSSPHSFSSVLILSLFVLLFVLLVTVALVVTASRLHLYDRSLSGPLSFSLLPSLQLHRVFGVLGTLCTIVDGVSLTLAVKRGRIGEYQPMYLYGSLACAVMTGLSSLPLLLRVHQSFHGLLRLLFAGCLANIVIPLNVCIHVLLSLSSSSSSSIVSDVFILLLECICLLALVLLVTVGVSNFVLSGKQVSSSSSSSSSASSLSSSFSSSSSSSSSRSSCSCSSFFSSLSSSYLRCCHSSSSSSSSSPSLLPWSSWESDVTVSRNATVLGGLVIALWTWIVVTGRSTDVSVMMQEEEVRMRMNVLLLQVMHISAFGNNMAVFAITLLFRGRLSRGVGLFAYNAFAFPVPFLLTAIVAMYVGQPTTVMQLIKCMFGLAHL